MYAVERDLPVISVAIASSHSFLDDILRKTVEHNRDRRGTDSIRTLRLGRAARNKAITPGGT